MTLLEVISNASANRGSRSLESDYPNILIPDGIFPALKPKTNDQNPGSLAFPLSGWEISKTDAEITNLGKKLFTNLKRKLKDTNKFDEDEFIGMLKPFLEKLGEKCGISTGVDPSECGYVRKLIEETGFLMGKDVVSLVVDGCVGLEIWGLLQELIVNGLVDNSCYSVLVSNLVAKNQPELLCLLVKHASYIGSSELLSILKYFLCPPKEAFNSMVKVREEWESQCLLAIEKASDRSISAKKWHLAKEASILLMVAHDGFKASELCLHFLLASSNVDEVVLAYAISKLSGKEMGGLIRYLGTWLKKYEKFPEAGPCPKAASQLGLKLCDWVPKLGDVAKCLGLVLDENFSSLVLNPDFHEELRDIEGLVSSLSSNSKFSCLVATVTEKLRLGSTQN